MNHCRQIAAVAILFLTTSVAAFAQRGMQQTPMPKGFFNPVVGSGAQYDVQPSNGPKSSVEFAVVGKESVNGKDGYWLEWTVSGTQMGDMIMKSLTVADGANTASTRMIMQMGSNGTPMEMPAQMTHMNNQQGQPTDIHSVAEEVGSESVTTPAGTFQCVHYKMKDGSGDTWVSDKVAPFGVVKFQGKDASMVLAKLESGVKDKITGTPQPFNPMMMMQRPPQ